MLYTGIGEGLAARARMVNFAAQSDLRLQSWITEMVDVRHSHIRAQAEAVIGPELPHDDRYEQYLINMCLATMKRYGADPT